MLLPILKHNYTQANGWMESLELASDKLKNDKIGLLSDVWKGIKKQLFEEGETPKPKTYLEKTTEIIYTGYYFGISSIGAVKETLQNIRFKFYDTRLIASSLICFILCLQFVINFNNKWRARYLGVLALLSLLCLVFIIGHENAMDTVTPLFKGWFPLLFIQAYFILSAAKYAKKENLHFSIMQIRRN